MEQRLAEAFADCITLILQLRTTQQFGSIDVLRERIKDLLRRAEREALRAGTAPEDVETAMFAVVAFLDETIAISEWQYKDQWKANPLQGELFGVFVAGEAFFERLQALREQPKVNAEVLEVYYLCMTLGFRGKYRLHDREQLLRIIEEVCAELSRTPDMMADALAPRGTPRDQLTPEIEKNLPNWVIVVATIVIALVVYGGMTVYINDRAKEEADAIPVVSTLIQ